MKIAIFKALWGMTGSLESQLERIAAAGYDGIECPFPADGGKALRPLLRKHRLQLISMLFTGGETVQEHIVSFREQLAKAAAVGAVKITAHSSRDRFSFDDQLRFYEAAMAAEAKCKVAVNHETHRGRAMFTPWTTAAILRRFPTLGVCSDFSHWVCVCESLLADLEDDLHLAISHTRHIHARVGYEEGPQVTDPAAPEFKAALDRHLQWWDGMFFVQIKNGAVPTITPEFGPPGYQHTLPYTQQPITDLWQICLWTANLLRERYAGKEVGRRKSEVRSQKPEVGRRKAEMKAAPF